MTLEEIKTAIVERIDTAWTEVKDQVDADKVRTYVQGLTAELLGHVYAVEAQLVNHVLGNDTPSPSPAPAADVPAAPVTEVPPAAAAEPAQSVPDGSVPAQPTGMASNPEPMATDAQAAVAAPEPTQ